MNVARTSPSFAMSSSVRTPDTSRTPRPRNATAVESSFNVAADAHSATIPTNAARTIRSSRPSGPSAASARRASAGASGVALISGAISQRSSSGISSIAVSVGTQAATSHEPNPISTPNVLAISVPSGLAAIAVSHNVDERLRLTMPENIRNAPTRRRLPSAAVAPLALASENASG